MDEFDAILSKYNSPDMPVDEFDMVLSKYKKPFPPSLVEETEENEEAPFNWSRFLGEQLARGTLNVGDLLAYMGKELRGRSFPSLPIKEVKTQLPEKLPQLTEIVPETVKPETPSQRIAGHAARGIGSALIPIPGSTLGKAALTGAGIGATSGALQEIGMPAGAADIAALAGAVAAPSLAGKGASLFKPGMASREKEVAQYLQETVGKENIPKVLERLRSEVPYEHPVPYKPTTAEIANSPALSQLQRAQHGVSASFIPEHLGKGNEALMSALEKEHGAIPLRGEDIQKSLESELLKRKGLRKSATEPLYEKVEKMTESLNPVNTKKFIKDTVVKGDLEKDLNYVKKLIQPKEKLTREEELHKKLYQKTKKENIHLGKEALDQLLSKLGMPKSNNPTIAELSASRAAINSRLKKYKKSGEEARFRLLREARNALDKDLEAVPLKKEADTLYRDLSKPVSEIAEHPTLKRILRDADKNMGKSTRSITSRIFNKDSEENVEALKKALGTDPQAMEGLRRLSIYHFTNSIKNKGAEGTANTLSYSKMDNFMKSHQKALSELLTDDQMKLINTVERILKGRNVSQTLGVGQGSPTAERIINEMNRSHGFSGLAKSHAMRIGKSLPGVSEYFASWAKKRNEALTDILNKALIDPKIAERLLSQQFPSQKAFNEYVTHLARFSPTAIAENMERRKQMEEEEESYD